MARSRNVGLVAVGVDTIGVLTRLSGAALGATQLAEWLKSQSAYGVKPAIELLVDTGARRVSARDVQDAVSRLLKNGGMDLLILYFAGHGIVKSGFDEQVLLSDVERYRDEAIAIAPTVINVSFTGVPHVIVISDACRNAVDPFGPLGTVNGKPAFELAAVKGVHRGKVDTFYATEPSQTAKEFKGEGFFTRVLLDALNQPPPELCVSTPDLDTGVAVIPAWNLETYLGIEVPVRAAKQNPAFDQTPDFIVTSREPQFFGYARAPEQPTAPVSPPAPREPPGTPLIERLSALSIEDHLVADNVVSRRSALSLVADAVRLGGPVLSRLSARSGQRSLPHETVTEAGISEFFGNFMDSETGWATSTPRADYTVVGDSIAVALLSRGRLAEVTSTADGGAQCNVTIPAPVDSLREAKPRGSLVLILKSGSVCVLPVLPGYVGTLRVRDGRATSLSFESHPESRSGIETIEQEAYENSARRGFAAALATAGKLVHLTGTNVGSDASLMQSTGRPDLTLSVYSAYGHALAGEDNKIQSIHDLLASRLSFDPVLFDVAMLAGKLSREAALKHPGFAPFCPMLSLGWSLMASFPPQDELHDAIIAAGKKRLNAEWTTFRLQDVQPLLDAFERGDIQ